MQMLPYLREVIYDYALLMKFATEDRWEDV